MNYDNFYWWLKLTSPITNLSSKLIRFCGDTMSSNPETLVILNNCSKSSSLISEDTTLLQLGSN